jgi:hypothetical protein
MEEFGMSNSQSMANVLSLFHDMAQKGPVLVSDVFDEQLGYRVTMIEFEVSNKSRVPDDLPFGILADIVNERNINKSRLKARILPGFFEWYADDDPGKDPFEAPWSEQFVRRMDQRICGMKVEKNVVADDFDLATLDLDKMVWQASLTPLSGNAQLLTIETVVNVNTENVAFEWDDNLQQEIKVTRLLMPRVDADFNQVGVTPASGSNPTQFFVTTFETVKCGWVEKVTREIWLANGASKLVNSYNTTVNYALPPVLHSLPVKAWETKNGAMRYYPQIVWSKEEFRGPMAALIETFWSPNPFTITAPAVLIPTEIAYSCPFFSLNTGACLHGTVVVVANTGSADPEWAANAASETTFNATNFTTWPATLVVSDETKPYLQGYIRQKVTITTPT